jgi:hypothetical protein
MDDEYHERLAAERIAERMEADPGNGWGFPLDYEPGFWRVLYKPRVPPRDELDAFYTVGRDAFAAVRDARSNLHRVTEPVNAVATAGPQPSDAQVNAMHQAREERHISFTGEVFPFKRGQITAALLHVADRAYVPVVRQVFRRGSRFVVDMQSIRNTIARERTRSVLRDAFRDALALGVATAVVEPVAWDVVNERGMPSPETDLGSSTHTGHWGVRCTVHLLRE